VAGKGIPASMILLEWIRVTAKGAFFGGALIGLAFTVLGGSHGGGNSGEGVQYINGLGKPNGPVCLFLFGAFVGSAQWPAVSIYLLGSSKSTSHWWQHSQARRWVLANALGWSLGAVLFSFLRYGNTTPLDALVRLSRGESPNGTTLLGLGVCGLLVGVSKWLAAHTFLRDLGGITVLADTVAAAGWIVGWFGPVPAIIVHHLIYGPGLEKQIFDFPFIEPVLLVLGWVISGTVVGFLSGLPILIGKRRSGRPSVGTELR